MANLQVGNRVYCFCPCCESAAMTMRSAIRKEEVKKRKAKEAELRDAWGQAEVKGD